MEQIVNIKVKRVKMAVCSTKLEHRSYPNFEEKRYSIIFLSQKKIPTILWVFSYIKKSLSSKD